MLRFHTPLIKPGGRLSRTRLSDKMVFDPLLFDCQVPVEEWRSALHDTPTLLRTAPGEPPLPARGGTGYWPAPDPLEGTDVHARETLEEYRTWNA